MRDSQQAAAPESGDVPEPESDPEILALLDFPPVPRKKSQSGGWTPPVQRAFIAEMARHGSVTRACTVLGKDRSGVTKLYNSAEGGGFRAAWHDAIALAKSRREQAVPAGPPPQGKLPTIDLRRKRQPAPGERDADGRERLPGQVLNEHGQWEDEASFRRRGEEAVDSIRTKLLRIRRLYLQEICESPGKRAAFEILTELPIDWDKAERGEAQDDEPYRSSNQRQPDMILTAESGWSFGEIGYGPDRKAEARRTIDELRAEKGLEPIDWEDDQ